MRQVGVLAAAGLYALKHNIQDLTEDHHRAARLAQALSALDKGQVSFDTNMVFFQPKPEHHGPLCAYMANAGM